MLAVLIDADNLSVSHAERLLTWVANRAKHPLVRVFGDFSDGRCSGWCELAKAKGFELSFQPNGGARKNSTDIALTIHAMDLLHEGQVQEFCLASNDRDFVPLAVRLRRAGRQVLAVGTRLDERMKAVCDDCLELQPAVTVPLIAEPPLVAAFRQVAQDGDRLTLSQLGSLLRKHAPQVVPAGSGKLRKALRDCGWFDEIGEGATLTIQIRRRAA